MNLNDEALKFTFGHTWTYKSYNILQLVVVWVKAIPEITRNRSFSKHFKLVVKIALFFDHITVNLLMGVTY